MKSRLIVVASLLLAASMAAQTTADTSKPKGKKPAASRVSAELDQLRQRLDDQQQQIQQLQQQLQQRDQQVQQLVQQVQNAASDARSKADAAASASSQNSQAVNALQTTVSDLKTNATNVALSAQEQQTRINEMAQRAESPLALHYKGITITPGGFLAAESVWRQHAMGSDVNTPFNSIPFNGADAAHLSEFFGSGRQSRITLVAEGRLSSARLTGYFETDWLSAGVTSNNNQSNSYTNRMRQLWGQVALENGWSFTGGQMWSLVTETKKGLDNRTEALPMTIDAQYHVGFSWMRQYGFRVVKNFNNKVWLGFSVENPQTTNLGGGVGIGGFTNFVVIGSPGLGGGLYNSGLTLNQTNGEGLAPAANYSFNYTPDFIVKAAFEPGFGHYEVFGIISNFRDRIYPAANAAGGAVGGPGSVATPTCGVAAPTAATPPCNDTRTGGGVGANARWSFFQKHVDFGIHVLGGPGVGRYGSSQLAEVTLRPNGTLALIHSYQALGTLEWHSSHWDIYANAGGEYAQRTVYLSPNDVVFGYGRPTANNANCLKEPNPVAGAPNGSASGFAPAANGCPDARNVIEGTFGFWYKPYSGPKGRIQFGPQYSYLVKNTWRNPTLSPHTVENMVFTSFRYYLP